MNIILQSNIIYLIPRLHLTVLTTRNEPDVYESVFQVLKLKFHTCKKSRLSILFINLTLRDLDNTKILLYKLFVRCLVVKPACVNAA